MNENDLVEILRRAFPAPAGSVGIGDDAAVVECSGRLAITTDMLIENHDFLPATPAEFVARKSLAANLSDLAAMGARPWVCTLSLGFPETFVSSFERFVDAFARAAKEENISVVGGDLSAAEGVIVSIQAIGRIESRPLLRTGAAPGHRIYVSRPLGGAAAGLELLRKGWSLRADGVAVPPEGMPVGYAERELAQSALLRQLAPRAEVTLGMQLAAMPETGACIDISDGLSTDLHRLCRASNVGAVLEWERIPALHDLERSSRALAIDGKTAMLHGGEEFSLLFTSSLRESEICTRLGRPVHAIGRVTRDTAIMIERDGAASPFDARGFDHFERGGVS